MTTKERNLIQGFINKLSEIEETMQETLENLQKLNVEHGDGHRWCSWKGCLDGVIENNEQGSIWRGRAEHQYERYLKAAGQREAIEELGSGLAELNFWKH